MPKIGPNLVMQTAMGPGPLGGNSPNPEAFLGHPHHTLTPTSMGFQQGMMSGGPQMSGAPPNMGISQAHLMGGQQLMRSPGPVMGGQQLMKGPGPAMGGQQLMKPLNMRNPGPVGMTGPHVNQLPGQTHRHMAPQFSHQPRLPQNTHFHNNYEIEPPRTPMPSSKLKSKSKDPTLQLSVANSGEVPMQADSPLYQIDTPRYQHQIKIEDNQDFLQDARSPAVRSPAVGRSPASQRSQTPNSTGTPTLKTPGGSAGGTPMMKDPFDSAPLTDGALVERRPRKRRAARPEEEVALPPRAHNKHIPALLQPDISRHMDVVVRGATTTHSQPTLQGSYGRAILPNSRDYYRDIVARIKHARLHKPPVRPDKQVAPVHHAPAPPAPHPPVAHHPPATPAHHTPTVLTPQQEKMLCQRFGITPAEAQRMYYYQQALREQHVKAYVMQQEQLERAGASEPEKSKVLEQIRLLQESRDKLRPSCLPDKVKEETVSVSVKQQNDSIQLIFQRPLNEKPEPEVAKLNKPKLELTKPTPPVTIKQEKEQAEPLPRDVPRDMSPRDTPFAITGPDFTSAVKSCNPQTDEKTTRVINLHKAFQMLSDMLGMKLKKDNLASLNELRVSQRTPMNYSTFFGSTNLHADYNFEILSEASDVFRKITY